MFSRLFLMRNSIIKRNIILSGQKCFSFQQTPNKFNPLFKCTTRSFSTVPAGTIKIINTVADHKVFLFTY